MESFEFKNQPYTEEYSINKVEDPTLRAILENNPELAKIYQGHTLPTEVVLNEAGQIVSDGQVYEDIPRMRALFELADAIRKNLPNVPVGHVRLWRGNRPDEIGHNPSYTNSLEGIALPFLAVYGGVLSYIDIPQEDLEKYFHGSAVTQSEFLLPADLVKEAAIVGFTSEAAREIKNRASSVRDVDDNPWGKVAV